MANRVQLIDATSQPTQTAGKYQSLDRNMIDQSGVAQLIPGAGYTGYKIVAQSTPDKTVKVSLDSNGRGAAFIFQTSSAIAPTVDDRKSVAWTDMDLEENLTIADNVSGLDRIDIIILRIDFPNAGTNGELAHILEVVQGTPAAFPTPPAVPDDSIKLAEIDVQNGFTAITNSEITDTRDFIKLRAEFIESPAIVFDNIFYSGIIREEDRITGGELKPEQNTTPNMSVNILSGKAFFGTDKVATPVEYDFTTTTNVTISPANPTNPRWTIVYLDNDGLFKTVDGVAVANPDLPALPANIIPIAFVWVGPAVTTINNPEIYNVGWYIATKEDESCDNYVPNSSFSIFAGTVDSSLSDIFLWSRSESGAGLTENELVVSDAIDGDKEYAYRLQLTDSTASGEYNKRTINLPSQLAGRTITISAQVKRGAAVTANFYPFVGIIYDLRGNTYELSVLDTADQPNLEDQGSALALQNTDYRKYSKVHTIPFDATNIKYVVKAVTTATFSSQDYRTYVDHCMINLGNKITQWEEGGNDEWQLIYSDASTYSRTGNGTTNTDLWNYSSWLFDTGYDQQLEFELRSDNACVHTGTTLTSVTFSQLKLEAFGTSYPQAVQIISNNLSSDNAGGTPRTQSLQYNSAINRGRFLYESLGNSAGMELKYTKIASGSGCTDVPSYVVESKNTYDDSSIQLRFRITLTTTQGGGTNYAAISNPALYAKLRRA